MNFKPEPPARHILDRPLVVPRLPKIILKRETLQERLHAFVLRTVLGYREDEYRVLWQLRESTAAVMASLSPQAAQELKRAGWSLERRRKNIQSPVRLLHPDQFRESFELVLSAPPVLNPDRHLLELLLALTLRHYKKELFSITQERFSFESKFSDLFMAAHQQERQIKNVTDASERFAVLQGIYNGYFHAASYYLYSLVAREKSGSDKMFSMYSHAVLFMSRLESDGTLSDAANRRRLPLRRTIVFLIERDRALQARLQADSGFAEQIRAISAYFPVA